MKSLAIVIVSILSIGMALAAGGGWRPIDKEFPLRILRLFVTEKIAKQTGIMYVIDDATESLISVSLG